MIYIASPAAANDTRAPRKRERARTRVSDRLTPFITVGREKILVLRLRIEDGEIRNFRHLRFGILKWQGANTLLVSCMNVCGRIFPPHSLESAYGVAPSFHDPRRPVEGEKGAEKGGREGGERDGASFVISSIAVSALPRAEIALTRVKPLN